MHCEAYKNQRICVTNNLLLSSRKAETEHATANTAIIRDETRHNCNVPGITSSMMQHVKCALRRRDGRSPSSCGDALEFSVQHTTSAELSNWARNSLSSHDFFRCSTEKNSQQEPPSFASLQSQQKKTMCLCVQIGTVRKKTFKWNISAARRVHRLQTETNMLTKSTDMTNQVPITTRGKGQVNQTNFGQTQNGNKITWR